MKISQFLNLYQRETGIGPDHCEAIEIINKARILAYPILSDESLMTYGRIKVRKGVASQCFYLPYEIEIVKRASTGCRNIQIEDASYCEISKEACACSCCEIEELKFVETGVTNPVPFDTMDNRTISFFPASSLDDKTELSVMYYDSAHTRREELVKLTKREYTTLCQPVNKIISIEKAKTNGLINMFVMNNSNEPVARIHSFYPEELEPAYSKYSLLGCVCDCISVYGKKRLIMFTSQDDIIDLNPQALLLAMKAILSLDESTKDLNIHANYVKLLKDFIKARSKDNSGQKTTTTQIDWSVDIQQGARD